MHPNRLLPPLLPSFPPSKTVKRARTRQWDPHQSAGLHLFPDVDSKTARISPVERRREYKKELRPIIHNMKRAFSDQFQHLESQSCKSFCKQAKVDLAQALLKFVESGMPESGIRVGSCQIKKQMNSPYYEIIIWDDKGEQLEQTGALKKGADKVIKTKNVVIVFDFMTKEIKSAERYVSLAKESPLLRRSSSPVWLEREEFSQFTKLSKDKGYRVSDQKTVHMQVYKGEDLRTLLEENNFDIDFRKKLVKELIKKWGECLVQTDDGVHDPKLVNIAVKLGKDHTIQSLDFIDFRDRTKATTSKLPYSFLTSLPDEQYLIIPFFVACIEILSSTQTVDGKQICDIHRMDRDEIKKCIEILKQEIQISQLIDESVELSEFLESSKSEMSLKIIEKTKFNEIFEEKSSQLKPFESQADAIIARLPKIYLRDYPTLKLELLNALHAATYHTQELPFRLGRCEIKVHEDGRRQIILWDVHTKQQTDDELPYNQGKEKHIKPQNYSIIIKDDGIQEFERFVTISTNSPKNPNELSAEEVELLALHFTPIEKTKKSIKGNEERHTVWMAPYKGVNLEYYIKTEGAALSSDEKRDLARKVLIANYDLLKSEGLLCTDQKLKNVVVKLNEQGLVREANPIDYSSPGAFTPLRIPFDFRIGFLHDSDYFQAPVKHCILILEECLEILGSGYVADVPCVREGEHYLSIDQIHDYRGPEIIAEYFAQVLDPMVSEICKSGLYAPKHISMEIYENAKAEILKGSFSPLA